jgi:hypothetical protein
MKFRSLLPAAAMSAMALSWIPSGTAANAPAPAKSGAAFPKGSYATLNALPDWGGIWTLNFPAPGAKRERPMLKGKYLAGYQAWQHEVETKHGEVARNGSYCRPPGMPGIMGVGQYPIEFLFTPGRVTTHHEAWMQWRVIYTDGRAHPDDWEPTFYGHSIGHWEGDTLVVDTVGIKGIVELGAGAKHSDKLHIVERIHLAKDNPDSLVVEMTADDALALEQPWHNTLTFTRSRDSELLEFVCAENDRNPVDESGHTGFE